ncbi:hypothetical protein LS73_004755 [Helicobacter muridarum]|uniref:Lipopolysaccharide heptosyltransferase family protein n=1 Tax=Helicobacter muridarum TaxID=216 RepID=A0A099TYB3_9HELI|nr:glycosyltransferase family 9 protein [Helicobacter muridarum]TLE00495.1 hypothetical protein LS73_004755 [Helicobacter muridarum]STQ86470.1 Uncharacterised protein [Helicobacter muridarum]
MTVGLVCYKKELGSSIIYAKCLFALKNIYQCKVVIFGNSLTKELFTYCDYIDDSIDMGNIEVQEQRSIQLETINKYTCDYLIASTTTQEFIQFLMQSNAKKIICITKLYSLFSLRCKSMPLYFSKKYRNMRYEDIMLCLARKIKPSVFDKHIKELDFSKCQIHVGMESRKIIDKFLKNSISKMKCKDPTYVIMVNPFNVNNRFTIDITYWLKLIEEVARIPHCIALVVTYPQVKDNFMQELAKSNISAQNLLILHNDNHILNLVAITKRASLVISPSTGTIHIASNVLIPTLGLYAEWDTGRWGTDYGLYIFLQKPLDNMNHNAQQDVVKKSITIVKEMIAQGKIKPAKL